MPTATLDPLATTDEIRRRYRSYLRDTFKPRTDDLARSMSQALDGHGLVKGPYLEASAPYQAGCSIGDLVEDGVLSRRFLDFSDDALPVHRSLYVHQEQAIRKAVSARRNLIVATGTGSGKTETFLIPILDGLFREADEGTLDSPGVRALLLYPMNALVNDQIKRLRKMLVDMPDVMFGRYVGETKHKPADAERDFRNRYPHEPRLSNELLSREEMQSTPPQLLITNYAMLEYLLLRPTDSTLFDGPTGRHWRSIVLDEAHIYDGAQGTEIAMLLRRVKDRVHASESGRLQCFATSATLGGPADFGRLVDFAGSLFGETFSWSDADATAQDIVTATRVPLGATAGTTELQPSAFPELRDAYRSDASVGQLHQIAIRASVGSVPEPAADQDPAAYLHQLLAGEAHVVKTQKILEEAGAVALADIADEVIGGPQARPCLVALVDLAVAAKPGPDDAPLIPARYHTWVGSLEGAYLCLATTHTANDGPRLHLHRSDRCHGCSGHLIELGVCRACGAEYAVGREESTAAGDRLRFVPDRERAPSYYLLWADAGDQDEDGGTADSSQLSLDNRWFDPATGLMHRNGEAGLVAMRHVHQSSENEPLHRCASCSSTTPGEVVYRVLTGTDAPVAVIATSLYQHLPPASDPEVAAEVGEGRKLLSFADSRQDAAYFAAFLDRTYESSISRRLIYEAVSQREIEDDVPRTEDITRRVRKLAEAALLLDPDAGGIANTHRSWAWVMRELLSLDRRQSLDGLGLAEVRIAIPRRVVGSATFEALGFDADQSLDLIRALLETVRASGAVTMPEGVDIKSEQFAPRNFEITMREEGSEHGVLGWLPTGKAKNRRTDLLTKLFAARGIDADPKEILRSLWRAELTDPNGPWRDVVVGTNDKRKGVSYRLNHERFEISLAHHSHAPSRCSACRRLWWRTVDGVCPGWRCTGRLDAVDVESLADNHYATLYRELEPIGLAAQEHTAQWKTAEASAVQDSFMAGRLNVLSCSTTFELGVDVGDVQAVLLRNVPPRASNYVQRAGRAGRRQDAAALVVTYAQRRSHDRQHFNEPRPMINGTVSPPIISLDNDAIVRRHMHSVAYAAYERHHVDRGGQPHRTAEDFLAPPKDAESPAAAVDEMMAWLRSRPHDVGQALARIVPGGMHERVDLDSWGWVEALEYERDDEPSFGWLGRARDEFREELARIDEAQQNARNEEKDSYAALLGRLRRTVAERFLLGFLATRNVLPKYGFPVDVVELDLSGTGDATAGKLELSRDLRLAISTYAPGAQVVAAKRVWRSAGVRQRAGRELPVYQWKVCKDCGAFRRGLWEAAGVCGECGSGDVAAGNKYVNPIFGFIGKPAGEAGESRPPSGSVVRSWFGSYRDDPPELEQVGDLHGAVQVRRRISRQGRIVTVNEGPKRAGFAICSFCGHSEPAPGPTKVRAPVEHDDLRRSGRKCEGTLQTRQLGHEYLTDVAEIRFENVEKRKWTDEAMRSLLYAVLAGAPALGIARTDIDGTLHWYARDIAPALIIFDAVPGGAGHARFLGERLRELFSAALDVGEDCDCGANESCYGCLRTYDNQAHHEQLSRGDAVALLRQVLGAAPTEFDLFSPLVHTLLAELAASGAPEAIAGYELADEKHSGWVVEAAWPDQRIGVVVDTDPPRDRWLAAQGWTVRHAHDWTADELLSKLGIC